MKKTLLWVCALIIVLGTALTVYAAPAPVEAPSSCEATDEAAPVADEAAPVVDDAAPVADEAARETDDADEPLDPRDFFEVNELGLTYGYAIYDDVRPDLVAALGTGGVHGYVYMEELLIVGAKRFPDDIVTDIPASIPLYASDGVTVIGEFPIGPRTDDSSDWIK